MYKNTYQKRFWADVFEIDELIKTMEDISNDDKRPLESYTQREVTLEAEYVLSTFFESGHINNSSYIGEHGEDEYHWAVSEVNKLKAFIQKSEGRKRA